MRWPWQKGAGFPKRVVVVGESRVLVSEDELKLIEKLFSSAQRFEKKAASLAEEVEILRNQNSEMDALVHRRKDMFGTEKKAELQETIAEGEEICNDLKIKMSILKSYPEDINKLLEKAAATSEPVRILVESAKAQIHSFEVLLALGMRLVED